MTGDQHRFFKTVLDLHEQLNIQVGGWEPGFVAAVVTIIQLSSGLLGFALHRICHRVRPDVLALLLIPQPCSGMVPPSLLQVVSGLSSQ